MVEGTDYPQLIIGFNPIKNMVITGTTRIICYNQIIYDDDRAEENEIFSLTMTVQTGSAMTTQVDSQLSSAIITILDDDSELLICYIIAYWVFIVIDTLIWSDLEKAV